MKDITPPKIYNKSRALEKLNFSKVNKIDTEKMLVTELKFTNVNRNLQSENKPCEINKPIDENISKFILDDDRNKKTLTKNRSITNMNEETKVFEIKIEKYDKFIKIPVIKPATSGKKDRNMKVFVNTSMSFDHNNSIDKRNFSVNNKVTNNLNQDKYTLNMSPLKSFFEN